MYIKPAYTGVKRKWIIWQLFAGVLTIVTVCFVDQLNIMVRRGSGQVAQRALE